MKYSDPTAVDTVLVTRYERPGKKQIQHVYGPYTKAEAERLKRLFQQNFKYRPDWRETPDATFKVGVHKLIGEKP